MLQKCCDIVNAWSLIWQTVAWRAVFLVLSLAFLISPISAQIPAASPTTSVTSTNDLTTAEKLKRWFEVDTLVFSTRYRHVTTNVGPISADQLQFQFQAKAHFKFDPKGKYSVYGAVSTGNVINSGWGSTGIGTGGPQTDIFLKQLYVDAKPVKGVEIQVGGITPNNGENTEVTGYDNDAYLMGQRVSIKIPKKLYFDVISIANGYFGDFTEPNVLNRFKHFNRSNYHQILVGKKIGKSVSFTADYTFEAGRDTFRQAVKFSIPKFRVFDVMRFENYQRVDPEHEYGFGIYGEKSFYKKLTLSTGFARIDTSMINGDRYLRGNRLYAGWNLKLSREFSFNGIWLQALGPLPLAASPRTRVDAVFTFNILETFRRFDLL